MLKSDLYGALSRGYCSEKNKYKVVDPDLIEAMANEILLLYCQNRGNISIQDCKCEDKNTDYHLKVCCEKYQEKCPECHGGGEVVYGGNVCTCSKCNGTGEKK